MTPRSRVSLFRRALLPCLLALPQLAFAFGEPFPYPAGQLKTVSGGQWTSPSWGNNSQIVTESLNGGATRHVVLGSARNDAVTRSLDGASLLDGPIYARFDLKVETAPAAGDGDYFFSLSDATGNRRHRVFIKRVNATSYKLGVGFASVAPGQLTSANFTVGQTYRVVLKIVRDAGGSPLLNGRLTLWVDPGSEGGVSITSTDNSSRFAYDRVVLRQSNQFGGLGLIKLDNLLLGSAFNEVAGPVFDVTDHAWGSERAIPGDGLDDGPGIRNAIAAMKASTASLPGILLFPFGDYTLTDAAGVNVRHDAYTFLYGGAIDGMKPGSVVEGSGSTIEVKRHGTTVPGISPSFARITPFHLANNTGLVFKNLRLRWERPSVTSGKVEEVSDPLPPDPGFTRKWTLKVKVDGLPLDPTNPDWIVGGISDMDADTGLPLLNLSVRDHGTPKHILTSFENSSTYVLTVRTTISNSGVNEHRLDHLDRTMEQLLNKKVVLHHYSGGATRGLYGPPALAAYRCKNLSLRDVEIYSNTGMGLTASECNGVSLRRVDLLPAPGRLLSTAKDGIFLTLCKGAITIDDCEFVATGDDAVNVHSTKFQRIFGPIVGSTVTAMADDGSFSGPLPVVGDEFQFLQTGEQKLYAPHLKTGNTPFIAKVVSASLTNLTISNKSRTVHKIVFDALPPGLVSQTVLNASPDQRIGDFMFLSRLADASSRPSLRVRNSVFNGGIARGLTLSAEDVEVTHSTFKNLAFNGIYFLANTRASGAQAPGAKNVKVENCQFISCGAAPIATMSPSHFPAARPAEAGMFSNFTIRGNTFNALLTGNNINTKRLSRRSMGGEGEDVRMAFIQAGLHLPSLGGVKNLIEGNTFTGTGPNNRFSPALYLNHSGGIKLKNNRADGMSWRRSMRNRPNPIAPDPVPAFENTDTGDLLTLADQEAVNTAGNPTTSDSDYFGHARQLGDIQ